MLLLSILFVRFHEVQNREWREEAEFCSGFFLDGSQQTLRVLITNYTLQNDPNAFAT